MASDVPQTSAKAFSNAAVRGPAVIHSESMASRTPASSVSSKSSSDSLAIHMLLQKVTLHCRKVDVCLFVVVRAANILPVGCGFVSNDAFVAGQQSLHKIGKVEFHSELE